MEITNQELYATPEYRKHLFAMTAIQLLGFIVIYLFILNQLTESRLHFEERIVAAAARIEDRYPDSFRTAVPLLLNPPSVNEIEQGSQLLEPFGYGRQPYRVNIPAYLAIVMPILFINYIIYLFNQKRLFNKIGALSSCILSILDGRPSYGVVKYDEGILDLFTSRFNQMVKKMQSSSEKLLEQKRFLEEIISDISHQLKTPMASLIMYNDLMMQDDHMDRKTRSEFLITCGKQLGRMEWLIKSLLKLARLETGTISFDMQQVDILVPAGRSIENLSYLIRNRRILISDDRTDLITVKGDPNWLCEALTNILKNAIEYTHPETGIIEIKLSETPLFLRIRVKDNGPGIPETDLPLIFERFYKGGNSVNMESVGIGLPLSRIIIEEHGGDLRVKSDGKSGTEFIITLPY